MSGLSEPEARIVAQVLADRRESAVESLLATLRGIADEAPPTEPKTYHGDDPYLNWESGHAEARWDAGEIARKALDAWEAGA